MRRAVDVHVGHRLATLRTLYGMTAEELAVALHKHPDDVAAFEAGETRLSAQTLLQICELLQVRVSAVFGDVTIH